MSNKVKSIDLLPEFLRTDKNKKFLSSTIDQLIQKPSLERLDSFVGSKLSPNYNVNDNYVKDTSPLRQNYQLSPALINYDDNKNITSTISFDDLINQIKNHGGNVDNLSRIFSTSYYSYYPLIDWDKFINYQEYFWLITGPIPIIISSRPQDTVTVINVSDDNSNTGFKFSLDSNDENPVLNFYRGNVYKFNVDTTEKFYIKTLPLTGNDNLYSTDVNGVTQGLITLEITDTTPDVLYYTSDINENKIGQIFIRSVNENTTINVENDIIGKKNYKLGSGIELSNGMKLEFGYDVFPLEYRNKQYFVEGVGRSIQLISIDSLSSFTDMADTYNDRFDQTDFDSFPFDNFKRLPIDPEYITINRASKDLNPWSRYNRWVHKDVIKVSYEANNRIPIYPVEQRAKRPIVEFVANLQLYNFGSLAINNVDYIDTTIKDAFSTIEGKPGFYIDGILIKPGNRVIFNADTDVDVKGRIYVVNYVKVNNKLRIRLDKTTDHIPTKGDAVGVKFGNQFQGTCWWYNGSEWVFAQQHKKLNEPPLFDLYDNSGQSYSFDLPTDFTGSQLFGYTPGNIQDPVLNFGIKQENSVGIGSYSFKNFLMTETFSYFETDFNPIKIETNKTFIKINDPTTVKFTNFWISGKNYSIPIIKFFTVNTLTSTVKINSVDINQSTYFNFDVFINSQKLNTVKYTSTITNNSLVVNFNQPLNSGTNLLFKLTTDAKIIDSDSYYEIPISVTNNPNNDLVNELTLSEIGNHVRDITESEKLFVGSFAGSNNLRDLSNINGYARKIVTHDGTNAFTSFFLGNKKHNVVDALTYAAESYNKFKLSLLKKFKEIPEQTDSSKILDDIILALNNEKQERSSFFYSDMLGYGSDKTIKKYLVTNTDNKNYPLINNFNLTKLSLKSVLVYVNNEQLLYEKDYVFVDDSEVQIQRILQINDVVTIVDYFSTEGNFVPCTPTKLGLYPKYEPKIFFDESYIDGPIKVIQGHDGSITVAFNDYRDDVILEFEKRIYNNIKVTYRPELLDFNSVIPGAFRKTEFNINEVNNILQKDFYKWSQNNNLDIFQTFPIDLNNSYTWNYKNAFNNVLKVSLSGYWRAVYKFFYDTDRPHTHPWEMLGFSQQPEWWKSEYGSAPYSAGNDILWTDLETGFIRQGPRKGFDKLYARPLLSELLPVDDYGNLVDPTVRLASNITAFNQRQPFVFGDQGPIETAWRRSSYYPFAIQKLLLLTKPFLYCTLFYDVSRIQKNIAGQWVNIDDLSFINLQNISIPSNQNTLTAGYSAYIVEQGKSKYENYVDSLLKDTQNCDIKLLHKVGGFVGKNKLQVIIDAFDPVSKAPGAILPPEDYELYLNSSLPTRYVSISGIIIQKNNGKFILKGYDFFDGYFTVYTPIRNNNTPTINVGGVSSPFLEWSNSSTGGNNGLSALELTTANSATNDRYYTQGQIVRYQNKFYIVKISHTAKPNFDETYFQALPSLPVRGGAIVQKEITFDKVERKIPYGTSFDTIQEVYDIIIGYGAWLEEQGFIFNQYNNELNEVINWKYSAKEFLYWTTQNWADNHIIAISPFADQLSFKAKDQKVDDLFKDLYNFKLLQVNGTILPQQNISVNREDGLCTINVVDSVQGMYFVRLNLVQKEHVMVFNNTTIFNDTIFDKETGYRQLRIKLVGFRTKNWDGDYFSPGFVYDNVNVDLWKKYKKYKYGDVVKYAGKFYSYIKKSGSSNEFNFNDWIILTEQPFADLLPNFDYKIKQFEDFYSLDIDNFDSAQQSLAQHLIGYTPRPYFNDLFTNPISQYKFYQGFIKEKGTKNAVIKLAKASIQNKKAEITYNEVWAFRVGQFGSYLTFKEIEILLDEALILENPQLIKFIDNKQNNFNDLTYYQTADDLLIKPQHYITTNTFTTVYSTFLENNIKIKTAGYARLDDVTATAYNLNSLYDIANNFAINKGDTFWIGFKDNGDWDVLIYDRTEVKIIQVDTGDLELIITTDLPHEFNKSDVISITQFDQRINGVYKVKNVLTPTKFSVEYTRENITITENEVESNSVIFKFLSLRFDSYNNLYSDNKLLNLNYGTKFWIDRDKNDKWIVYEKVKNYVHTTSTRSSNVVDTNHFGYSLFQKKNSDIIIAGATNFNTSGNFGKVHFYKEQNNKLNLVCNYTLNDEVEYYVPGSKTDFGYSLYYDDLLYKDTGFGLVFAGAPLTSNTKSNDSTGTVRLSTGSGTISSFVQEGAVKISRIDSFEEREYVEAVLLSPVPSNYQKFGSSIYVQSNTSTKLMLVGAPETLTTGTGKVFAFHVITHNINPLQITTASTNISINYNGSLTTGSQWGYSISGSYDAKIIAIGAPGRDNQQGVVQIFSGTTYLQTLSLSKSIGRPRFGDKILVTSDGSDIFVTAPGYVNIDESLGRVLHYQKNSQTNQFELKQTILNPVPGAGMKFGSNLDIDVNKNLLVISALGNNKRVITTFDSSSLDTLNNKNDKPTDTETYFDAQSTLFVENIIKSGSVYLYDNKNSKFALVDEIYPDLFDQRNNYGQSVLINENSIYVGAPSYSTSSNFSYVYNFKKIDQTVSGYKVLRSQDNLIDVDLFNRNVLIDTKNENILEYLDIIDPVKGKIAGAADQELSFKSEYDPAIYSIGTDSTNNDSQSNWLDEYIGKLWWDLSTVKYLWYEQGESNFRKNNWGKVFPGSTIDVYEWVRSEYLPSEWATLADTAEGLVNSISGQPKYPDNSVLSVKQVLDPVSGTYSNVYYYWVKNKVTVPSVRNRRISSYQVSNIIADPVAYGAKTIQILGPDALSISNVTNMLQDKQISLNVTFDEINNQIPRHTEWLLLQENSDTDFPNALLEKKLLDSIIGKDRLGNLVPDPKLSFREKYGISIRPQQSIFKNRYEAMRNIVEFVNDIFSNNLITDNYSFINLNKEEQIPEFELNEYDILVEDFEFLELEIPTPENLKTALLSAQIKNGKLINVVIEESGFGYRTPPTVEIINNSGAKLQTVIDTNGRIISVIIENAGESFASLPTLVVRPFTALLLIDETSQRRWSKYIYNLNLSNWVKISTQKFNTKLYWNYIDWISSDYKSFVDFSYTINDVYELKTLSDIKVGQYVKIKNGGANRFIILEKINNNIQGSFGLGYNIVYSERGTIKLNDNLWNYQNGDLAFDQNNRFDQTLYDQTPETEIINIFNALKNDIFIDNLKINWNLLWFNAVKYALTEQKLLDWAFKTSFIDVINNIDGLIQKPVYKLENDYAYEEYLKEVKPYHSVVRKFTNKYISVDPSNTFNTDFDLPTYYDVELEKFNNVDLNNQLINQYPYKSWKDNYTYFVDNIVITNPGENYSTAPLITITTATGDSGFGASAKAYITGGKVSFIEITNKGSNYTRPPQVNFIISGTNITTATAYVMLGNNKVRNNKVKLKFDRISKIVSMPNNNVSDSFICDGFSKEFILTWLAYEDKSKINVFLDGNIIISSDYSVSYFTKFYNGYNKKHTKIVFNNTPSKDKILLINYVKSAEILDANQRILSYYSATNITIGKDVGQLVNGINYQYNNLIGLTFDYTSKWDVEYKPFGSFNYADNIEYIDSYEVSAIAYTGSSVISLTTTSGIEIGNNVNIVSYLENRFLSSSSVVVLTVTGTNIIVNSTLSGLLIPGDLIEIWKPSFATNVIDTDIDGGTWINSTSSYLSSALGINPEDVILSGNGFFTNDTINSTEEFVPGFVSDTLGINVYTKSSSGAPLIFSSYAMAKAEQITFIKLKLLPPGGNYIRVLFNDEILEYNSAVNDPVTDFSNENQFTIDWVNSTLIVNNQPVDGIISYTIIGMTVSDESIGVGIVDYVVETVVGTNRAHIKGNTLLNSVGSVYVTVNGDALNKTPVLDTFGYKLVEADDGSGRAAVDVYFNVTFPNNTIQVYFFSDTFKYFNDIKEQSFVVDSTPQTNFVLSYPPGVSQPLSANILVEYIDGLTVKRLLPPYITYYDVNNSLNNIFDINKNSTDVTKYDLNNFDLTNVKVYINGVSLRPGFDYTVISGTGKVSINQLFLNVGSTITIETLLQGLVPETQFDFYVTQTNLILQNAVSNVTIKAITFNDHDGLLFRTERFVGFPNRRYKISRPVLDDEYVWVTVNGIPLANKLDYEMLDDSVTVQISDRFNHTENDEIVIMSIGSNKFISTVLGYRIFQDIFNRTHFKRLSKRHTTYLTSDLNLSDTEIKVADASVLTFPILSKKIPGVILIDGERIEFYKVEGNILKQIRRSTLGTGPKQTYEAGTKVIDQGTNQTIPQYSITSLKQSIVTTSSTRYSISTVTNAQGDGLILPSIPVIKYKPNQISVYYGGKPLRKFNIYKHDIEKAYDSSPFDIKGTINNTDQLPSRASLYDAYLNTLTNQTWIFTNSKKVGSIKGFEFNGVSRVLPEFSLDLSSTTNDIVLGVDGGIQPGVNVTLIQKQFNRNTSWNNELSTATTLSLFDSNTLQAKFLQAEPAELPINYY